MAAVRASTCVFGLATMAAGILNLIWGDFEAAHQPIQAFGDHIPGRETLAYIAAIWLIAGGAAMLWRRTAPAGAAAVALIYFIFAAFWLPRFYSVTQAFGFRVSVYIGVLAGVAQQLILAAAAAIVYASAAGRRSWGSNAYNLAAVGAVWLFAEWLARRRVERDPNAAAKLAPV